MTRSDSSNGAPLPPDVREFMEERFGRDFGQVRLHNGELADASARALGAQAYTVGNHVVFARGRYDPARREGRWLLAHELAHVVQQGGGADASDAGDALEAEADQAADIIAAGHALPRDFRFGAARRGLIQRHVAPPCTGFGIEPDPQTAFRALQTLEAAYRGRMMAPVVDVVVYGSNNFQWPENIGVGGKTYNAFITELLGAVRQRSADERPNIINFAEREVYFCRRRFEVDPGLISMIGQFHGALDRIGRKHGQAPWLSANSNWYPNHSLPITADPLRRFVCTQATEHNPPRGLILYDIRGPQRQRRAQRRAVSYELWTADIDMAEFFPSLKAELPNAVRTYDPDNSNFVFIVPADFYYSYYNAKKNAPIWESYKVGPSYDFPGGQAIKEMRSRMHHVSKLLGIVGLAVIVVGSIVFIAALPAAAAGAGAVATTGTAAGAGAAVSLPATTTVVAPAGVVVQTWAVTGTAAATAGGGATAALWAVASAPAAKIAATAGVLLLIGTVKNAHAGTGKADSLVTTQVSAFRAVPVADFKPFGTMQAASSYGPPPDFFHTPETARGKFNLGTKVMFDNVPHIIIGGFSAS